MDFLIRVRGSPEFGLLSTIKLYLSFDIHIQDF